MRVAIIGAGAGGLAAAYDLSRAGDEVVVFEAADQVGGLASGFKAEGWDWSVERFYHHWFATDRHILGLIDELGWRDRVRFPWPVTAVFDDGQFYPLDGPISRAIPGLPWLDELPGAGLISRGLWVFRFPGLSLADKLRYGWMGATLLMARSWMPFAGMTAPEWVRCEGMLVRLKTPVDQIRPSEDGGLDLAAPGGDIHVDQCLVTTSPALLAKLAPELPPDYLGRLLKLRSMGAVVLVLALNHRLSEAGYYWHNLPKAAGFPFLALVEHTNFLSPDLFGGEHIVYCGDYLDPDHEYFHLRQDELLDRFLPALPRFNRDFRPDWVRRSWLFRTPYAQPIPPVNHSRSIPDLRTPIRGLWLASMSQVYPLDRGTNFAVEVARQAARRMLSERMQA